MRTFLVYIEYDRVIQIEADKIRQVEDAVWLTVKGVEKDSETVVAHFPTNAIIGVVDQQFDLYHRGVVTK